MFNHATKLMCSLILMTCNPAIKILVCLLVLKTLEHIYKKYPDYLKIYIDGSRTSDGTGTVIKEHAITN